MSETLKDNTQEKEPSLGAPGSERAKGLGLLRQPRILLGAMAAVLIVGAVIGGVVIYQNAHGSSAPSATPVGPVGLSESGLRTLAAAVGQPIYWAGPRKDYLYELTRTRDRKIFIRYLPPGARVGAKGARFLIIATYPFANAFQALKNVSHGQETALAGGGIALVDTTYPKSVHLAFPGVDYEIEVYDPSPARARAVAVSGDVRPAH
jgi:hypothetical protein